MVRTARPMSKGWPPPAMVNQMNSDDRAQMAKQLSLDLRRGQQVKVQVGSLDGQLAVDQDQDLVKYQHCQQINKVNLGARIWTASIPRMRLKRVRDKGVGLEAQADT